MKDINTVKNDFPIFKRIYNGKPLVYLDTAATSQKPYSVIDSQTEYYSLHNANVHRGVHFLSDESTDLYEQARIKVQKFLNAESSTEVIFTKGATEGLNRVAMSYAVSALKEGDSILLLDSEHHSNFVPWQEIANILKLKLIFLPLELDGSLDLKKVEKYFTPGVKIISLAHVSNVLGNIYPIKQLAKLAHSRGAVISVDGAQAVGHIPVDVVSLGCDFYSFSAHKMYGPMGVGALYIKKSLHDLIPPFEFGGGMIRTVSLNSSTWAPSPEKYEAGTPNVAGAYGLGIAVDFINSIGMDSIVSHGEEITGYAIDRLSSIDGMFIYGPKVAAERGALVSFSLEGLHSHDVAAVLNAEGIAVRSGQHCTMPLHDKLQVNSTIRASFGIYTTKEDIDALCDAILKAIKLLRGA